MKDEFRTRLKQLEEVTNWLYQQGGFSNDAIKSLKIKRLDTDAKLPTLAYEDPVAYDLYANEKVNLDLHEVKKIPTGLAMEIPQGYVGVIKERSSTPKKGLHVQAGVIDPDFRGHVKIVVSLNQVGQRWGVRIRKGDKIAQMLILKKFTPPVVEVNELSNTERGEKGWGSSD